MRLTWKIRRKCFHLANVLALLIILVIVSIVSIWLFSHRSGLTQPQSRRRSYMSLKDMQFSMQEVAKTAVMAAKATKRLPRSTVRPTNTFYCTMGSCFDVSRCTRDFKVYIYPPDQNEKPGAMYKKILKVIRDSSYYTENPYEACIYILNLDTLDRDSLSKEYVKHLPEKLKKLTYWNNGKNHLIFNFFSGSFPDYSDELKFPYGEAILAKASFSVKWYRPGFDISLPLLPKKHPEKGREYGHMTTRGNLFPINRHYLLVFKGKRYLWGLGSETRNALHHLHNGRDIIMLTTCKHGKFWNKYQDQRCNEDNSLYEKYDYNHLLTNSTFCLVPRGRRLGSFRFLESIQAGCIPVSLSNGFVVPFQEVIDWNKALITLDERQLFQMPHILRNIPHDKILSLRVQTQLYWEQYLSSIEKVIYTTLEVIKGRIQRTHGHFIWNHSPGALSVTSSFSTDLSDYPFFTAAGTNSSNYTAIILATEPAPKGNSPLVRLLKGLCNTSRLSKIIISWIGAGTPKVMLPAVCTTPIVIIDKRQQKNLLSLVMWPLSEVDTDAILTLYEDSELISDEAEFGYSTWLSNPDRLVGFTSQRHYWSPSQRQWKYSSNPVNRYSLVSIGAAFYHRYYAYFMSTQVSSTVRKISDSSRDCLDVSMNFLISDITGKSPLKVTQRLHLKHHPHNKQLDSSCSSCINLLSNAYGYMPLKYSVVRADPVLFKDDVSMLRKEFRKLEIIK